MLEILAVSALFAFFGLALGFAGVRFKSDDEPLIESINSILPQTQCGQCGYPGCRPYAEAIAKGEAEINQCPPGGADVISALAEILGSESKPLNTKYGEYKPKSVAFIVEQECIGCVKCIEACPVDAILGSATMMHTAIASECTGCELCLPACPVDCIVMQSVADNRGKGSLARPNNCPIPAEPGDIMAAAGNNSVGKPGAMPCIRCGDCVTACPVDLLPQELFWHCRADQKNAAEAYRLFDCIECGRCDSVCPSHIPLVASYRATKKEIVVLRREKQQAEIAKQRYQAHTDRLAREQADREARLRKRKSALQQKVSQATDHAGSRLADSRRN